MAIISSGIWDIDPTVTDGTQLAGYLNELVAAINTNQSSATRPPMIKKGGLWTKTLSGSDIAVMVYDGTKDYEIGKIVGGEIQIDSDSIWTEVDGVANYDGRVNVKDTTRDYSDINILKDSNYVVARAWNNATNSTQLLASLNFDIEVADGSFRVITGGVGTTAAAAITADKYQYVTIPERLYLKNPVDGGSNASNMYMNADGLICKTTATTYTTEEVDKKLAIKDKLIESLTKRLDELEKKVK